jgi:hypothetical protein
MADWGEERWSTASVWFGEQGKEKSGWLFVLYFLFFFSFVSFFFLCAGKEVRLCSAEQGLLLGCH